MFALKMGLESRPSRRCQGICPPTGLRRTPARSPRTHGRLLRFPVAQGSPRHRSSGRIEGPLLARDDGLANTGLPEADAPVDNRFAPDVIVDLANEYAGELVILALGPLTNVASQL